jgi:hypothetical protein
MGRWERFGSRSVMLVWTEGGVEVASRKRRVKVTGLD